MDLLKHKEINHIHDSWPDSGSKRDSSMIKTSSLLEPKKKAVKTSNIDTNKLPDNVKELPPLVKCKYPDSKEFCVVGDVACCLNCLAAGISLDPSQGPALGRDFNTHIAEYRPYYKERLVFPLTITIGGEKRVIFEKGEEDKFFDTLVSCQESRRNFE